MEIFLREELITNINAVKVRRAWARLDFSRGGGGVVLAIIIDMGRLRPKRVPWPGKLAIY